MGLTAEDVLIRFRADDQVTPVLRSINQNMNAVQSQTGRTSSAFNNMSGQVVSSTRGMTSALSEFMNVNMAVAGAVGVTGVQALYDWSVGASAFKESTGVFFSLIPRLKNDYKDLVEYIRQYSIGTPVMFRYAAEGMRLIASSTTFSSEQLKRLLPDVMDIATAYKMMGKPGGEQAAFRDLQMFLAAPKMSVRRMYDSGIPIPIVKKYADQLEAAADNEQKLVIFHNMMVEANMAGMATADTYTLKLEKFKGTIRAAGTALGNVLLPPLSDLLEWMTAGLKKIGPWPIVIAALALGVGVLAAAVSPFLLALWQLLATMGLVSGGMMGMSAAGTINAVTLTGQTVAVDALAVSQAVASATSAGMTVNTAAMTPVLLTATASTGGLTAAMGAFAASVWAALAPLLPIIAVVALLGYVLYEASKKEQWFVSSQEKAKTAMSKTRGEVDRYTQSKQKLEKEIADLEAKQKKGNLTEQEAADVSNTLAEKRHKLAGVTERLTTAESALKEAQGLESEVGSKYDAAVGQAEASTEARQQRLKDTYLKMGYSPEEAEKASQYVGDYKEAIKGSKKDIDDFLKREGGRSVALDSYLSKPGGRFVTKENVQEYGALVQELSEIDRQRIDPNLTKEQKEKLDLQYEEKKRYKDTLDNIRKMKEIWAGVEWQVGGAAKNVKDFFQWISDGMDWIRNNTRPPEAITNTRDAVKAVHDWWNAWIENLKKGIGAIPGLQELADTLAFITGTSAPSVGGSTPGSGGGGFINNVVSGFISKIPSGGTGTQADQVKANVNKGQVWDWKNQSPTRISPNKRGSFGSSGMQELVFPDLDPKRFKELARISGGMGTVHVHQEKINIDASHMSARELKALLIEVYEGVNRRTTA